MTQSEIQKLATDTYELGIQMNDTFAAGQCNRDYMILAIMACISGLANKSTFVIENNDHMQGPIMKELRKEKGYTLRQVEDATGISNSYLSQMENGKIVNPSNRVIMILLKFYNTGIGIEKTDDPTINHQ